MSIGMTKLDIHLGVGSGSHAEQTAKIMIGFEKVCIEEKPDWFVVAGDVNSTLAEGGGGQGSDNKCRKHNDRYVRG